MFSDQGHLNNFSKINSEKPTRSMDGILIVAGKVLNKSIYYQR